MHQEYATLKFCYEQIDLDIVDMAHIMLSRCINTVVGCEVHYHPQEKKIATWRYIYISCMFIPFFLKSWTDLFTSPMLFHVDPVPVGVLDQASHWSMEFKHSKNYI